MVDRYAMKENSVLKAEAWVMLTGNWGISIAVSLVMGIILSAAGSLGMGIGAIIIGGAIEWGLVYWFVRFSREGHPPEFSDAFHGFNYFGRSLAAYLLVGIYVCLWSLLLIVPGIVFSIAYSQVYFILRDHPELNAGEALRRSREMMKGAKAKYFWLILSFIGWYLLSAISFGIAWLWAGPYIRATQTKFYDDLKANYKEDPVHTA